MDTKGKARETALKDPIQIDLGGMFDEQPESQPESEQMEGDDQEVLSSEVVLSLCQQMFEFSNHITSLNERMDAFLELIKAKDAQLAQQGSLIIELQRKLQQSAGFSPTQPSSTPPEPPKTLVATSPVPHAQARKGSTPPHLYSTVAQRQRPAMLSRLAATILRPPSTARPDGANTEPVNYYFRHAKLSKKQGKHPFKSTRKLCSDLGVSSGILHISFIGESVTHLIAEKWQAERLDQALRKDAPHCREPDLDPTAPPKHEPKGANPAKIKQAVIKRLARLYSEAKDSTHAVILQPAPPEWHSAIVEEAVKLVEAKRQSRRRQTQAEGSFSPAGPVEFFKKG